MRPSALFLALLMALALVDSGLLWHRHLQASRAAAEAVLCRGVVSGLGLTDLSLVTEARYTRHPALSDALVPFMDHPRGLEHFPSGSFLAVPQASL